MCVSIVSVARLDLRLRERCEGNRKIADRVSTMRQVAVLSQRFGEKPHAAPIAYTIERRALVADLTRYVPTTEGRMGHQGEGAGIQLTRHKHKQQRSPAITPRLI